MISLVKILEAREQGGTAMHTKSPSKAILQLFSSGKISGRVLDYGAGHGRNADFLRSKGLSYMLMTHIMANIV